MSEDILMFVFIAILGKIRDADDHDDDDGKIRLRE